MEWQLLYQLCNRLRGSRLSLTEGMFYSIKHQLLCLFLNFFQFAVTRRDGTPYTGRYARQVVVQVIHEGQITRTVPEEKLIIPDDNIIRLTVMPFKGDDRIKIRVC